MIVDKGTPRRDGSGRGIRLNRGRGGCVSPTDKNIQPQARRWGRGRGIGWGRRD